MTNRTLLIDGDWLCYKAATSVETEIEWAEDQWTLTSDAGEAMELVDYWVAQWLERIPEADKVLMSFSDPSGYYFRHDIFPKYKGNRKGKRKPVCYKALRDLISKTYSTTWKRNLEADDLMGVFATSGSVENPVIVTIDKDLDTVPGWHYNPDRDELYEISEDEARWNHMFQTLVGDSTDGFKGCPGVGKVGAKKILDAAWTHLLDLDLSDLTLPWLWEQVYAAFDKEGVHPRDANIQAQLAHILQAGDYDFETGEVRLKQWM